MLAWAVVPTFGEVDNLELLLRRLRDVDADLGILVVNDCSTAGTSAVIGRLADELGTIEVLDGPSTLGSGSAYRAGFARAIASGADVCIQIEADGCHDLDQLPALLANIAHGADLAIGSRYVPGGKTENRPYRRLALSRWGNRYAAALLGLAVNDATAGYRAYRCDALKWMEYETVTTERYGFQIEMTHRMVRAGGKIVEFPIEFHDRRTEGSKLTSGVVREALNLVVRLWINDLRDRRRRRRLSG